MWESCLQTIRNNVNMQAFRTWFEPIKPVRLEGNALTIQVPNKYFYEWLEEHYVTLLKTSIRSQLGDKARLEYQILVNEPREEEKRRTFVGNGMGAEKPTSSSNGNVSLSDQLPYYNNVDTDTIKNPFVIPGIKKMKVDPQLNPNYRFDNYIEGDCNRLARSAGLAISRKPGQTSFNPLVIFGNVGLGKTHLAQAIGNEILDKFSTKTVLYVSAEKFTNQIIAGIKNNAINDVVTFYQLIDVLIVDDIQFLEGKKKTQDIFFHIFNQLHQNGKQIILTSDRPPKDLQDMEERLISRFKWGLSADLQAPDLETRIAILEHKSMQEGVEMAQDVTEFICYNIKNNIRELEGVLISLIAQSSLNRREIDIDLAKEVVRNFVTEINKEITVEFIQKLVAEYFKVPVETLNGKTRKRSIVIARQLSMYLAKNMTDRSLKALGEVFGGRDHSTVIYSCRTVQDLMETDPFFKETVSDLEKKIRMSLSEK